MALLTNEATLRLTLFAAVLLAMLGWQALAPARTPRQSGLVRQANNIALLALDTALVRLLFPVLAVGLALRLEGSGLLASLPRWLAVVAALILFDLAIYWQHRLFHLVPALWRLHRVHHADPDFDVTTALRFHPGEIILSMLIKLGLVWLLGPPAEAVLIFEILLNASSMFNHGNVRLPVGLEQAVRRLVVTPDLHRVHHSANGGEMNHNFGFCLSIWDRWFGTLVAEPAAGHAAMRIGLPGPAPTRRELWLDRLLLMPWRPAHLPEAGPD